MKDLRGKNAILTGGSGGIGHHIARALADEGVNIALVARSAPRLEAVAGSTLSSTARHGVAPAEPSG